MDVNKKRSPALKPDAHFKVNNQSELMIFLIESFPNKSRDNIKSFLSNSQVEVNGAVQRKYNFALKPGDMVTVRWAKLPESKSFRGFSIVFEDEHLIVIDKHAGVLSIATDGNKKEVTAYNFLSKHVKFENPTNKIFIVHRLDRETSGLMVFAKSEKVQQLFQDDWKGHVTERMYVAIVEGKFDQPEGEISSYLHENKAHVVYSNQIPDGGKKAVTHYKVIKTNNQYSLLEVWLDTGRKNQIRVHMQQIGHCIVNDKKYGSKHNPINRLGLHSKVLEFVHPITRQKLRFNTPMPRKFKHLI
jgi:23S rRNA pseudouridine1911/1915/1917 synthase